MKTYSPRVSKKRIDWSLVDAKGQTLGRLSTQIAIMLMGKDKPTYSPHMISGDKVVVVNASKVKVTGNKLTDKIYHRHSGYPGGIKSISLKDQLIKDPAKVIIMSVKGMLPKNKLSSDMLKNLKVYPKDEHPHSSQINKDKK